MIERTARPIPLKKNEITDRTVGRLVAYRRLLQGLEEAGAALISSKMIGDMLGIKSSQVRKDLSYLGEFGKRGVGYSVPRLLNDLSSILAPFAWWRIGLVGLGRLGEALLGHSAFRSDDYEIVAAFDVDGAKIGRSFAGWKCYSMTGISETIRELGISVLMITTPAAASQSAVDAALAGGHIKGILNFSPVSLTVPQGVEVNDVDISVELEKLLFRLKFNDQQRKVSAGLETNMVQ